MGLNNSKIWSTPSLQQVPLLSLFCMAMNKWMKTLSREDVGQHTSVNFNRAWLVGEPGNTPEITSGIEHQTGISPSGVRPF